MENHAQEVENLPEHSHGLLDFVGSIHIVHVLIGIAIAVTIIVPIFIWRFKRKIKENTQISTGSIEAEKIRSNVILNSIADGVLVVDSKGVIRAFNPPASRLTGWEVNEAIGVDYRSVIRLLDDKGESYTEASHPISRVFMSGKPINDSTAVLQTKSGQRISVDFFISPLQDKSVVSGAVAIFRDVSLERKEEKQRADFISTASHEMRTPVAAIEGYLALALNANVSQIDSKAREFLEKAHASTQHLGKLFQDLLTSAKVEDGRLSNHPVVIEMGAFMEDLVDDLKFAAVKKGLLTEFVLGSTDDPNLIDARTESNTKVIKPLYYVLADPDRVREVITNLFDNAVKYTDQGKVTLGLTGNDEVVQIHVADTGIGIPTEDIPHLFQKFYRVDSSVTRTVGGTGLGLFICRKIVELYQGRIWVTSVPGKGSTFYINIPRLTNGKASELIAHERATASPLSNVESTAAHQTNNDVQ